MQSKIKCNFDHKEASQLRDIFRKLADGSISEIALHDLPFVNSVNYCRLFLKIGDQDQGVIDISGKNDFDCILTAEGWENACELTDPFCIANCTGYQWLYDLYNNTDLLFSPNGKW